MKMLEALKSKVGKNLFTNYLPERAHYSQAIQEHVPVWRFGKDVRSSLPPMRAFLEEAMTRIGSVK
jgi:chromosome partitioning protein